VSLVFFDDIIITTFDSLYRVFLASFNFTVTNGSLSPFLGHDAWILSP